MTRMPLAAKGALGTYILFTVDDVIAEPSFEQCTHSAVCPSF